MKDEINEMIFGDKPDAYYVPVYLVPTPFILNAPIGWCIIPKSQLPSTDVMVESTIRFDPQWSEELTRKLKAGEFVLSWNTKIKGSISLDLELVVPNEKGENR